MKATKREGGPHQQVGARELKVRLGKYLRMVREGRTLVVTDRGEPIAELRPVRRPGETELQSRLRRMAAQGRLTLGRERGLRPLEPVASLDHAHSLSRAVVEDREDRF